MASLVKSRTFSSRTACAFAALLGAGCASTRTAHIYEASSGRVGTLEVESTWSSAGRVTGALPDGEKCFGTVGAVDGTTTAVLTCGADRVIQCAVAGRAPNDAGFGICRDDGGKEYDVFF